MTISGGGPKPLGGVGPGTTGPWTFSDPAERRAYGDHSFGTSTLDYTEHPPIFQGDAVKDRFYGGLVIPPIETDPFKIAVDQVFAEAKALLLRKHEDYGPGNIGSTPVGPEVGLIVRIYDKVARLAHLKKANRKPNNESVRDSWIDIANYGIIGVLVADGTWPTNGDKNV